MGKNIFWGIIVFALIALASGCKKSCGINCLHGGFCLGNSCSCPDPYSGHSCDTMCILGYEGYMCQTLSREKFLGTWSCTSTDQNGNRQTYLITFTTNGYPLFMNLNNFNNDPSYPITCTLSGKYKFDINAYQQDSLATVAGISGDGNLNNGKITMYIYTANNSYLATATMQ